MEFGYTIVYVADVPATIDFYERAFGIRRKFVSDDSMYAELETGATTLSFAAEAMAETNHVVIRPNRLDDMAAGIEVALVTAAVQPAYEHAVAAGATPVASPMTKPWGQTVAYVRDNNGVLIELCTPVGS